MEFPGLGTLINTFTIIVGAALGVLIGSRVSEKLRDLVSIGATQRMDTSLCVGFTPNWRFDR